MKNTNDEKTSLAKPQAEDSDQAPQHVVPSRLPGDGLSAHATTKDDQIAELQEKLTEQVDARSEDRFWFAVVVVILLDFLLFPGAPWLLTAITLFLQLAAGVYFARKMGHEQVAVIIDAAGQLFSRIMRKED